MGFNMNELIKELQLVQNKIKAKLESDRAELSVNQKEINDILHVIEYHAIKVTELSKLTKRLKQLYKERRILKESAILLQNVYENNKDPEQELKNSAVRIQRYEDEARESYVKMMEKLK